MKRLLIIMLIVMVSAMALASQEIKIGTGEWAPYSGAALKGLGFANDVVAEAFKLEGISVKFEFKPWSRIESETADGLYLATPCWAIKEERKTNFVFNKKPIILDRSILITLTDSKFDWKTMDDLKKYNIGYNRADYYGTDLQKIGVKVTPAMDYDQSLKMLIAKRFDALVINEAVGKQLIRSLPATDQAKVRIHPVPYDATSYFIMFSKKYPNFQGFVEKFDSGFDKLVKSGKYDAMLKDLSNGKYD